MPYFTQSNQEIYYRVSGNGTTALILIHGWYQNGAQAWGALLPHLKGKYRIVIPDLPGHGLTALLSPDKFTTSGNHDLLIDFIRYVKKTYRCRKIILVGHSYGAFAALSIAAKIPQELAGIVGLAAIDDYTPYAPRIKRVLAIPHILIRLYYRLQALLGLFPYGDRMLLYGSTALTTSGSIPGAPLLTTSGSMQQTAPELIPGRLAYAKIKNRTLSQKNSHAYMQAFVRSRIIWPQKQLPLPILLLYGKRDALTASSWSKKILPHFKTGAVTVIADAGHNVQISGAKSVAMKISNFFKLEKPFRHAIIG